MAVENVSSEFDTSSENYHTLLDALEESIILALAAGAGSLLVRVVLEDLLAVGLLDLLIGGLVAVLGETENGVVVLVLPVLGVAAEHHRVLGLADLAIIVILNILDILGGLDPFVLGEGTLVALLCVR